MYQYKLEDTDATIILRYVTSVGYNKLAGTFNVYSTDNGNPTQVPNKFYYDFMNKLSSYVKGQE